MQTPTSSDTHSHQRRRFAVLLAAVLLPVLLAAALLLPVNQVTAQTVGSVLYRVNTGNGQLSPADSSTTVWSADTTGSPSPYLADPGSNDSFSTSDPISMTHPSIQGGPAPEALFQTERYDTDGATAEMQWEFPITGTQLVEVRLYLAEIFQTSDGLRVFDVAVEGTVPSVYNDIDIHALVGHDAAIMLPHTVTVSDGTLDVDFLHGAADNPKISGIEVVALESEGYLAASPSSHGFGSVALDDTVTQTMTLQNAGVTETIHITSTTISGDSVFSAPDISLDLSPGATTTLDVSFTPTDTISYAADLVVEHDGTNSPVTIPFNGEGFDATAPPVSFDAFGLQGVSLNNPTSLEIGPDGRLYVSQQNGIIYAYEVTRTNTTTPTYQVVSTEQINLVHNIVNHNDDGTTNTTQDQRQVTGLVVSGTASSPVLYVSSSDPRISVDEDSGLDTNSGIITRLTWNGTSWDRVDIVRGLPRSEENHSTNGLDLDAANNVLYVAQGGHTNKGAPGSNFAGTPEYFFSGAILSVDLDAIESMPIWTDQRTGTQFIYDLQTLDDPQRSNITNADSDFPYPSGHPRYNQEVDPGDPFGGNNGSNMAVPDPSGPVQIHAPGFRNPYDVLYTTFGQLYTYDNGPNGGWGGLPLIYDSSGTLEGYQGDGSTTYDPGAGDYCTSEFNEDGSSGHSDSLHYIDATGYYGGHPAPIRAFPEKAGIYIYEESGGSWTETAQYTLTEILPPDLSPTDFSTNTEECNYNILSKALETVGASTNGLAEYTASNFGGKMQGDLLAASFDGNIYRYQLNVAGDSVLTETALFSGFGSTPLDVKTQGDGDVFPGTVWAATYGSDDITVFEPVDFATCTGDDDSTLDEDGDGYDNEDEIDNGTDPCSAASQPPDADDDGTSDLNDPDDDNDGILDGVDAFAIDPNNGTATQLPIDYLFFNEDPGTGFFGLGFTGLMTNGTDYLDLYDPTQLAAGGASGKMTVEAVTAGDAFQGDNSQENGFQFGIDVDTNTRPFIIHTNLESPFFDGEKPQNYQSFGMFIGDGGQANYLKVVMNANGGDGGVEVLIEETDVAANTQYSNSDWDGDVITEASAVDLYLEVDPQNQTAQPRVSVDGGATIFDLGAPVDIPAYWLDPNDDKGMAVGIISTSTGPGEPFDATWDFINIDYVPTDAEAFTGVTLGGGLDASTYSSGSFEITNESPSQDILTATIDLSSAMLPNMVFDPADGSSAGDTTNKCLVADSDPSVTGYVTPTDNCADPFRVPHENGYYVVTLNFTDFNPGETFTFSVDVDPTSIQGSSAPGPGESGSVSGLELTGSAVNVEFSDLASITSDLYRQPLSDGGGQVTVTDQLPAAPAINVVGLSTSVTTNDPSQTISINGPPDAEVALLVAEAALFEPSGGVVDPEPYEGNSVVAVNEYTTTLDTNGAGTIPVTLTNSDPTTSTTYGLNYMTAVVVEPDGDTSPASNVEVVEYDPDYVPAEVLFRVNNGGPQTAAADGSSPDWSEDQVTANADGTAQTGTPSPYVNSGEIDPHAYGVDNTITLDTSVPPAAPMSLFQVERWDDSGDGAEMQWDFPVTEGTEVEVRLYLAEIFDGIDSSGQRVFDVSVEGTIPTEFNDIDPYDLTGGLYNGTMISTTTTVSDGDNLDLDFIHVTENPAIKGIEIIQVAPPAPAEGPVITIEQPADGEVIVGDEITVTWSTTNTNPGDHVHLTLDDNPYVGGLPLDGSYVFTDVVTGTHVITGQVASTTHVVYTNTEATDVVNVTVQEPQPAALIQVNPGGGVFASTYTGGAFQIENTGAVDIFTVTLDLSTAWMPDVVFDPQGTAGDADGKCLTADSGSTATGFVTPSDPCSDPYSVFHNGTNADDGYDVLTLQFNDFNPGETFSFSTDLDPTSIKNATDTGDAGAISGFEIIGALADVEFAGDVALSSNLYDDGSLGGSAATVTANEAPAPTIDMQGVVVPTTLGDANQTVLITGTPGADFSILQPVARLYLDENTPGGYDIDPFEANEALAKSLYSGTFDGSGNASVPVTLFIEASPNAGPDANLNQFIAVEENASGDFGLTSNSFVVEYVPEPQEAVCVNAGGGDYTASNGLFFMSDTYFTAPTGGTYSVTDPISNTVDDPLFQTERYGDPFTYTIPVTDGTYIVDLMFAELYHGVNPNGGEGAPGDRVFSVDLEGSTVLSAYDIISETDAPLTAITETFTTTVSDGAADISFYLDPGVDNAKVSAICVTPYNEPPTAEAGPDQTVVDTDGSGDEVVTLDESGSSDSDGTIVSYMWSDSGGQIATGVSPTVTLAVGTHPITLTVEDDGGKIDTDSVTITVQAPPTAEAGPDQTVVDTDGSGDEVVTLDGSGSTDDDGTIVSYMWSDSGGQIATGVSPTVTLAVGTHSITLTVTDSDSLTDTDSVTVTVQAPPTADAGPDQAVTDDDDSGDEVVTLDGSDSTDDDGTIISYMWGDSGGQIATGVSPTVTLDVGTHTITLTVTDGDSLTDTDSVTITVNAPDNEAPVADAGPDQTMVDDDDSGDEVVTLDGSGSNDPDGTIVSYSWSEDGTEVATGEQPTVTLDVGTHTIVLTVTDGDSLTDTDSVTITVNAPDNEAPVADAGPDQTVIDEDGSGDEEVTLDGSVSSDPDGEIVSYSWTEDGTDIATGEQPTVTFDVGTHSIVLTVTDDDGATDTDTVTITVQSAYFQYLPLMMKNSSP